jgi:hypothetical protein
MVLNTLARSAAGRVTRIEIDRVLATSAVDHNRLLRRLAIQEFIRPTPGSTDQEFPFRLIRRWRLARGA